MKQNPFFYWSFCPRGSYSFFLKRESEEDIITLILQHRRCLREARAGSDRCGVNPSLSDSEGLTHRCHPILGRPYPVSTLIEGFWPKAVSESWGPAGALMEDCFSWKEGERFSNVRWPHRVWTVWTRVGNCIWWTWRWCFRQPDPFLVILAMTYFGNECSGIILCSRSAHVPWSNDVVTSLRYHFHTVSRTFTEYLLKIDPFWDPQGVSCTCYCPKDWHWYWLVPTYKLFYPPGNEGQGLKTQIYLKSLLQSPHPFSCIDWWSYLEKQRRNTSFNMLLPCCM